MKTMNSKFQGYCGTCHFTIWKNERINYDGKAHHLVCETALKDATPRILNPAYLRLNGKVDKVRLAEQMERRRVYGANYKHRANRGVRQVTGRR